MFALVDCNNFFVSCERVFNPKLRNRPVIILSNNDGCVISRSNEAKALGIPMGIPFFKCRDLVKQHHIAVCSSNYLLYGDMSQRIMSILENFCPDIQIYSIDEAFLDFDIPDQQKKATELREKVALWTGIPISIGIGSTKTLAKAANHIAKKNSNFRGICLLTEQQSDSFLANFFVGDLWGVGRQYTKKLLAHGIHTALDFKNRDDLWIKKNMSVIGQRIAWELRGQSCFSLENAPQPKRSITSSRCFGSPVTTLEELCEGISLHAACAAEKLRNQKSLASCMFVFYLKAPFQSNSGCIKIIFPEPTAYTPEIICYAKASVKQFFRQGDHYRKCGVILEGLIPEHSYQRDFFINRDSKKQEKFMTVMDEMNRKFGYQVLHMGAEGLKKPWKMQQAHKSQAYTTHWDQLLTVRD